MLQRLGRAEKWIRDAWCRGSILQALRSLPPDFFDIKIRSPFALVLGELPAAAVVTLAKEMQFIRTAS